MYDIVDLRASGLIPVTPLTVMIMWTNFSEFNKIFTKLYSYAAAWKEGD